MNPLIKEASQYKIKEVVIVTKGGPIEVTDIFEEINIFDSLFISPVSNIIFEFRQKLLSFA